MDCGRGRPRHVVRLEWSKLQGAEPSSQRRVAQGETSCDQLLIQQPRRQIGMLGEAHTDIGDERFEAVGCRALPPGRPVAVQVSANRLRSRPSRRAIAEIDQPPAANALISRSSSSVSMGGPLQSDMARPTSIHHHHTAGRPPHHLPRRLDPGPGRRHHPVVPARTTTTITNRDRETPLTDEQDQSICSLPDCRWRARRRCYAPLPEALADRAGRPYLLSAHLSRSRRPRTSLSAANFSKASGSRRTTRLISAQSAAAPHTQTRSSPVILATH